MSTHQTVDVRHRIAASLTRLGGSTLARLPRDVSFRVARAAEALLGLQSEANARRDDAVRRLCESRLFDVGFYAAQTGLPENAMVCARHYVLRGAADGYLPSRLFDTQAYLARHADVAESKFEPFLHFLMHGLQEGRVIAVPKRTLRDIAEMRPAELAATRVSHMAEATAWTAAPVSRWSGHTVAVYASSLGNFFFADLADRIASALRNDGIRVCRLDQNTPRPSAVAVDLFIAPHEFFHLGAGVTWSSRHPVSHPIMLNTEQPGTHWHFLAMHSAGPNALVVDLSPQSALIQQQMGRSNSAFLPIGWHPRSLDDEQASASSVPGATGPTTAGEGSLPSPASAWSDRPIDVLFLGTLTDRRSKALARLAPTLSKHTCFVQMPTIRHAAVTARRHRFGVRESVAAARRAKILLNIHREDVAYFEWHRIVMMGMQQGALVVSEPCWDLPGIDPHRHVVTSSLDDLPTTIDRLLSPEGQRERENVLRAAQADLPATFDLRAELRALAHLHAFASGGTDV